MQVMLAVLGPQWSTGDDHIWLPWLVVARVRHA
jgi:hypothetical protein